MFNTFGNKVRIRRSVETELKKLAGKTGEIYGVTTPSVSGVEVIGKPKSDHAVNVYFDELKTSYWFDEELLEQVDNGEGSVMKIGDKSWVKTSKGEWAPVEEHSQDRVRKPKWWEFWKDRGKS